MLVQVNLGHPCYKQVVLISITKVHGTKTSTVLVGWWHGTVSSCAMLFKCEPIGKLAREGERNKIERERERERKGGRESKRERGGGRRKEKKRGGERERKKGKRERERATLE